MGGAPYKSAKEGSGRSFDCFRILTTKEQPRHVYSDLKPSKQIIGHKITYNVTPAASKLSPDDTQHSELYDVMESIL